jgi:hypothetical protein
MYLYFFNEFQYILIISNNEINILLAKYKIEIFYHALILEICDSSQKLMN